MYILGVYYSAYSLNNPFSFFLPYSSLSLSSNPLSNNSISSSNRSMHKPVYSCVFSTSWADVELEDGWCVVVVESTVAVGVRRTVAAEAWYPAAMSSRESPTCGMGG